MSRYVGAIIAAGAAVLAYDFIFGLRPGCDLHSVAGSVVLITGASSGIGAELAQQYGAAGARLMLAARREAQLATVCATAVAAGATACQYRVVDMRVVPDVEAVVTATVSAYGRLDLLLLNHAAVDDNLISEHATPAAAASSLTSVLETNVIGAAAAAHASLPPLRSSGGHMSIISSAVSAIPGPFHAGYAASKRALHGYFDTLRAELQLTGSNVTVGLHVLGMIATPEVMAHPGNAAMAMPVADCARDIMCANVARVEVAYVPRWYRAALTALGLLGDRTATRIMWSAYLGNVQSYVDRIATAAAANAGA